MDYKPELKLQAYVDGELSPGEARRVEELLAADPAAQSLVTALQDLRGALKGAELERTIPESRDFYWSKISRQIHRSEPVRSVPAGTTHFSAIRRFLVPASAVATVLLVGLLATFDYRGGLRRHGPEYETALADPGALTYRDYANHTTLVWLSYPADSEYE